jgi:hypothetical protein
MIIEIIVGGEIKPRTGDIDLRVLSMTLLLQVSNVNGETWTSQVIQHPLGRKLLPSPYKTWQNPGT